MLKRTLARRMRSSPASSIGRIFSLTLPHSDACFVAAYPAATTGAWLDGHNRAFFFFGGVSQSILYDNDKCLVSRILPDGTRQRTRAFSGLQSHYLFEDRYGRPGKGNDKGNVEGVVGYARRNFMTPLPRFASWDAFNVHLEEQCRNRQGDVLRGHRESIGERFVRDREALMSPLPAPFDACDKQGTRVSSLPLVRYQRNDYSVPVAYGHQDVWIRGYGREIAPLPMLQLALPDLLEAGNGRGREPRRLGPQEGRKRLAEIARGDALQIKPGQEVLDRLGAPEIGRQDP